MQVCSHLEISRDGRQIKMVFDTFDILLSYARLKDILCLLLPLFWMINSEWFMSRIEISFVLDILKISKFVDEYI